MKDNRRDFIRKSASLAAAVSVAGLSACTGADKKSENTTVSVGSELAKKINEWPFTFGPDKPKMCLISSLDRSYMRKVKQIGVDYILCGGPQIPERS